MRKLPKIIILVCIIITIILILLIVLNKEKKQEEIIEKAIEELGEDNGQNNIEELYGIVSKITDADEYYTAKNIMEKYIYVVSRSNYDEAISLFEDKYSSNIKKDNIYAKTGIIKIKKSFEYYNYYISNINKILVNDKKIIYIVDGKYVSSETGDINNIYTMIELDLNNYLYNIYPNNYVIENKFYQLKVGDKIQFKNNEITNRTYNKTEIIHLTESEIITNYFNDFKDQLYLNDAKTIYDNFLYEEYRNNRFETIENFSEYLEDNRRTLANMKLTQHIIEKQNDYIDYICIDQYENYYVFRQYDEIMKYKVILDTYTLEDKNFEIEYNNSGTQKKVMLNIDKFIKMINSKDYKNAYNLLDETFRKEKFGDVKLFKEFIKDNFFEYNKALYIDMKNEGEINIYNLTIYNKQNEEESINITIIMQIKDNMEFVMSFSVDDKQ